MLCMMSLLYLCDFDIGFICCCLFFFFFKQKTAYEMRISDWSSDVCSSDLDRIGHAGLCHGAVVLRGSTGRYAHGRCEKAQSGLERHARGCRGPQADRKSVV